MTATRDSDPHPEGARPVRLPELGVERVLVTSWFVSPGENVEAGERLVEVLMPGVTVIVSAPASGTLKSINRPVDAFARAGEVLGWIAP